MAPGASGSGPDAPRLGLKVPASFFSSVGFRFRPRCIAAKYVPCEEIANYARAKNRVAGLGERRQNMRPPPAIALGTSCLATVDGEVTLTDVAVKAHCSEAGDSFLVATPRHLRLALRSISAQALLHISRGKGTAPDRRSARARSR